VGLIDPAKVVIGGQSDPEARYFNPIIVYPVNWKIDSWRMKS
jgi:hypothetical protein